MRPLQIPGNVRLGLSHVGLTSTDPPMTDLIRHPATSVPCSLDDIGGHQDTVDLYLNGKIDQWYSQQERRGVVFILNVTDPAAARDMLEKLPLGQAHLMSFELIPIGPLNPLRQLQGMKANP